LSTDDALRSARELQDRLHAALIPAPPRTKNDLRANIRALLIGASDEGALSSRLHEILSLLNYSVETNQTRTYVSLSCGESMDKGQAGGSFLLKPDGSRLSFALTVVFDGHGPGALVAYRFHLQFPDGSVPPFLRFDLNHEPAAHEPLHEPRYHIHPGSNEIRVQIPPMTPAQVLHKLIYGVTGNVNLGS
jgi:hypothetical protein